MESYDSENSDEQIIETDFIDVVNAWFYQETIEEIEYVHAIWEVTDALSLVIFKASELIEDEEEQVRFVSYMANKAAKIVIKDVIEKRPGDKI